MKTAWPYPIGKNRTRCLQIDFHLVNEYWQTTHTCDIALSNNRARPMKVRCCVFNKVFLVNHSHDILYCSCKWLCFSNSCKCIGPKS